jgi:lysophospholipase L1-like esterase
MTVPVTTVGLFLALTSIVQTPATAPATAPAGTRPAATTPATRSAEADLAARRDATGIATQPAATAPEVPPSATAPSAATGSGDTPPSTPAAAPAFALQNGDRVVFVGDELVELPSGRRTYRPVFPLLVESFTCARYPGLRIHYMNAGWSGDTAGRVLLRLDRDVLPHQPTVVAICLGMNDAGYLAFDDDRLATFRRDLTEIVQRCRAASARVWLVSPSAVDEDKGRRLQVTRDGRTAVTDLKAIRYNDVLARYAEAMQGIADATPSTGFVDWHAASRSAMASARYRQGLQAFTSDGRLPQLRGYALAATLILRAWNAEPIEVTIEFDWHAAQARVTTPLAPTHTIQVQTNSEGQRLLNLENLPLPWPMPGGQAGSLGSDWEATTMCPFTFRMTDPPELGIVLNRATPTGSSPTPASQTISPVQLAEGFPLTAAEPLRSLEGARELYNLIGTKNGTQYAVWRRLKLSPPREPELAEGHRKLIEAYEAYVRGYEELVFKYPKAFNAQLVLSAAEQVERLPVRGASTTRPEERYDSPQGQ